MPYEPSMSAVSGSKEPVWSDDPEVPTLDGEVVWIVICNTSRTRAQPRGGTVSKSRLPSASSCLARRANNESPADAE